MSDPVDFFFAGGTLRPQSPSYVTRPADRDLLDRIRAGEFCYVLTSRQMGKSSLMVRTARRLADEQVKSVIVDLTSIGTVSIQEWYLGLLARLRAGLQLATDIEAWWHAHANLSEPQRFAEFLRDVVLAECAEPVVIFIDEIDTTLNLDFRDDFFAAIRAVYNARAAEPIYNRLTFVLLGVATPTDLIQDRDRTPFNIGRRILLREFSYDDAEPLCQGLDELHPEQSEGILARIFHWTNGHPYLTQKLCIAANQAPAGAWDAARVDELVETSFFSDEARKDSNLTFVQDRIHSTPRSQRRELLKLYRRVYAGERVVDDDRSPTQNHLELFGLVRVEQGLLRIRNEIYRHVFNQSWIKANMPSNRQLMAAVGASLLAVLSVGVALNSFQRASSRAELEAASAIESFQTNSSPTTRLSALAYLINKSPYDQKARELFFALPATEQRDLFLKADLAQSAGDIPIVIDGIYKAMNTEDRPGINDLGVMDAMMGKLSSIPEADQARAQELAHWMEGRQLAEQGCRPGITTECQQAIGHYDQAIDIARGQKTHSDNAAIYYDRALANATSEHYEQALIDLDWIVKNAQATDEDPPRELAEPSAGRFINSDYTIETVKGLFGRDARLLQALQGDVATYTTLADVAEQPLATLAEHQTETAIALVAQTQTALDAAQATSRAVGAAPSPALAQLAAQSSTGTPSPAARATALARPTRVAPPTAIAPPTEVPSAIPDLTATAQAATAIAEQPAKLAFVDVPDNVTAGDTLGTVGVQILDSAGNPVASDDRQVTLTLDSIDGTPNVKLLGKTTAGAANGTAQFKNLAIQKAGAGYRLVASADGLPDTLSQPFEVIAGPAAKFVFTDHPGKETVYLTEPSQAVVEVHDNYGNLVTNYDGEISVGIAINSTSFVCGNGGSVGPAAVQMMKAVNGQISLGVDGAIGYSLSAPGLQGAHRDYFVFGAPTLELKIIKETNMAQVSVVDAAGRQVFNYSATVTLTIRPVSGTNGGAAVATLESKPDFWPGEICFSIPSLAPGMYSFQATSGALASAAATYTVDGPFDNAFTVTPTSTPEMPTNTPTSTPTIVPQDSAQSGPSFTVNSTQATTDGVCSNSNCTLREAIAAALAFGGPAQVTLATATYSLTSVDNNHPVDGPNGLPDITSQITIKGNGATITRDPAAPHFRIFHVGSGGNLTLNNLTVSNGLLARIDEPPGNDGSASTGGGAYVRGALTLNGAQFAGNSANEGGGIFTRGTLTLNGSTLANNNAPTGGGAIRSIAGAQTTILKSSILNNTGGFGGGVADFGTLTVEDSRFSGNSASSGGGLYSGGTATIRRSTFSGNSTSNHDGGALFAAGTMQIVNSTISGNSAGGLGGGIVTSAGGAPSVTIHNSTFAGNRAASGGNIHKFNGQLTLIGTIVANAAAGGNCVGAIDNGGGNLQFPSASCGTEIAQADPLLLPLADNGGPTFTHALPPNSPAIDTADATGCPPVDQRGITRPQGARCDIGAYEAAP